MRTWTAITLALLAAPQDDLFSNSYKGKAPPELASEKGQWINAADALTLATLKGKPVWVEFGFIH